MKAEILKLAGVKNEKEFYKKFPTEEAFMAKYGKKLEKLKKAKVGDYISSPEAKAYVPLSYSDASNKATELVTGVNTAERQRQESLDVQKQIAANKGGGGLLDILSQAAPMLSSVMGGSGGEGGVDIGSMISSIGAKNGKKLKKAEDGVPLDALNYMDNGSLPPDTLSSPKGGFANNMFASQLKGRIGSENPSNIKGMGTWGKIGRVAKQVSPALANQVAPILGAFEEIDQQKKNLASTKMQGDVSGIVLQAKSSRPEQVRRRYVRPEDNLVQGTNPLGTGTNYLAAENGAEIANTYAPDVMYTDLGYEPLNDSNVKQYKKGGKMKKGAGGLNLDPFAGIAGNIGGSLGSSTGGGSGKGGPGSTIGSTIGGIAGSFIPIPGVGTALGSLAGGFIGGLFDSDAQKQQQEAQDRLDNQMQALTLQQGATNFQQQNKSFMEDGGWVSNDWQPQVITSFGDHSMKDLLAPDPMMDTLRAGGHLSYYTPPSERAMYTGKAEYGAQMAMGGDLQVHRGKAETISTNPYLPNNGETVMFRGPSHDNGGMPISYGENGVEVEGGEPAQVMKDGGTKDNLVVFGNMRIPDYGANEIGDKKAKGMKFKRYIADLSKQEAKNNKKMDKAISLVNDADVNNPFDQLAFNSGQAMLMGTNMQLKDIADKKLNTAAVQNAILDTADEYQLDSAKLAEKNVAGFGGKFTSAPIAKDGIKAKKSKLITNLSKPVDTLESFVKNIPFAERKAMAKTLGVPNFKGTAEQNQFLLGKTQQYDSKPIGKTLKESIDLISPNLERQVSNIRVKDVMNKSIAKNEAGLPTVSDYTSDNNLDWTTVAQTALTSAAPFLRERIPNPLDPSQLNAEMMAMAMNQEEPVQAQLYQPIVTGQPTSFSLQDQLNEVTAQSRAAEKMAAYNPEAAAMIFSQASQAKSKILGEQFRMNQAEKQRVAEQNAAILNDAQLKNLSILDQQYVRQAEAKSKTKAQSIEIAKSIADKIAQNKLENKQLRVMENMYPGYSFTSEGTVYKNPLYQAIFNTAGSGKTKDVAPEGYEYETILKKKKEKNGGIVKAFKNF